MTGGLVIALPGNEARLKRKVRAHFKRLGFLKAADGTLLPPGLDKQSYRDMHAHHPNSHPDTHLPPSREPALDDRSHGSTDPTLRIRRRSRCCADLPAYRDCAIRYLAVKPLSPRQLLLENSHLQGVWTPPAVSGLG